MVKAVIFDLDGTLIDSTAIWEKTDRKFLKSYGIDPPAGISDIVKKMTIKESSEYFIKRFNLNLAWQEVKNQISELVRQEYYEKIPLKNGVMELLEYLYQKNIPCSIATASYPDMAKKCLERLGILDKFKFIFTTEDFPSGKTNPEIYIESAKSLGVSDFKDVLVIEDSLHCVETTMKAGFFTLAVRDIQPENDIKKIIETADIFAENIILARDIIENEISFERVGEGLCACVDKNYKFGTDAILLSSFAYVKHKSRVLDIGTGCGIIPILLQKEKKPKYTLGVDIQENAIRLAQISLRHNTLNEKVEFKCLDIRENPSQFFGQFDYIICNPPYFEDGKGKKSIKESKLTARHDVSLNISELAKCISKILTTGKKAAVCGRPERLAEYIREFSKNKLEIKKLRFVHRDKNSKAWLFLAEFVKDANQGMTVLNPLLMYENGEPINIEKF